MSTEADEDMAKIQQALDLLGEHFDAVQIFAIRDDGGEVGTVSCNRGVGNWWSRYGFIRGWLIKEEEQMREVAREDFDEGEHR